MLTSLHVEGFRCFRSLTVGRLARVNLFVGLNNAGKTSVLDAVELLLGRGEPVFLWRQAWRRGDILFRGTGREIDTRHMFHGHALRPAPKLVVEGDHGDHGRLEIEILARVADPDEEDALALGVSVGGKARMRPLSPLGGLAIQQDALPQSETNPVRYLNTEDSRLGELWDRVVLTDEEANVTDALRLIEPSVERIAYAKQQGTTRDSFLFKLAGSPERVPLGNMGDGTRRLLSLSLHLARSANGALLVDEIDTGLHYSVMVRMWRLVIETARRLGVQVFATTHSLDCILALAELCERFPDLAGDVLLHRIERGVPEAVTYTADALRVAAEQQMEVRGHAAQGE
jgi:hypothetical protein